MADVVSYMSYEALQVVMQAIKEQIVNQSVLEAVVATGAGASSAGVYSALASTAQATATVPITSTATAAEAFATYTAAGGATAAGSGAAASAVTGSAQSVANIALTEGATSGTAGVAGLLTVPLPAVAAAVAPVLGVALGAGLYSLNPELWTKISQTLLPFCYEDSETMPVTVDEEGNTYIDEEAIEALRQLFEEEGIGEAGGKTGPLETNWTQPIQVTPANTRVYTRPSPWVSTTEYYYWKVPTLLYGNASDDSTRGVICFSDSPSADFHYYVYTPAHGEYQGPVVPSTIQFTYDNKTVYAGVFTFEGVNGIYLVDPTQAPVPDDNTIWVAQFGIEGQGYPEGTSQWEGDPYPETVTPLQVLTEIDPNDNPVYTPYYPVALPIGDPGVSTDPEINPDPAINPMPEPVITPYISPVTSPELVPEVVPTPAPAPTPATTVVPQPATENVPSPDVDPSIDQDPAPEAGEPYPDTPTNPEQPEQPTDEGNTPTPVLPVSPIPSVGALGLLHVYNPTQAQVDAFGAWLWETWSDSSIWETIQKLFNDPMDGVIGLHELYATPNIAGSGTIRCGYLDSEVSSSLVGSRYTTINCGTVIVEEYYQNYLDYSPYTQCYIYLPFIGIVSVSSDDIVGNAVQITYRVDSYTGACIAIVTCAKDGYSANVYQFEGNCAVEVPITSGYQSTLMSGLLALAGTAVTGNPLSGLAAGHMGRSGLGKNEVQHSGSFGASYGAMGAKVPYLIVKRPVQKKVTNYSQSYGYPAHKMVYIGNCRNFLRVKEVRVLSTTATNEEKDLIVQKLKEGVYVR